MWYVWIGNHTYLNSAEKMRKMLLINCWKHPISISVHLWREATVIFLLWSKISKMTLAKLKDTTKQVLKKNQEIEVSDKDVNMVMGVMIVFMMTVWLSFVLKTKRCPCIENRTSVKTLLPDSDRQFTRFCQKTLLIPGQNFIRVFRLTDRRLKIYIYFFFVAEPLKTWIYLISERHFAG